jgi:hypothetical protein
VYQNYIKFATPQNAQHVKRARQVIRTLKEIIK